MGERLSFPLDHRGASEAFLPEAPDALRDMMAALCGDDRPSALVIADEPERARLAAVAADAGGRVLGAVAVDEAAARLDRIADVDLVVLWGSAADPALPALLVRLDTMARLADIVLVVVTRLGDLDRIEAHVGGGATLLCDPAEPELAAAIAVGLRARPSEPGLRDIGRESEESRLEKLSEEVSRLARTLDALTRYGTGRPPPGGWHPGLGGGMSGREESRLVAERKAGYASQPAPEAFTEPPHEPLQAGHVRDLLRIRRMRDQFLAADLFADPAWDMLLDLMAARLAGERVSVSSLCIAAAVPPTTALRWFRQLTDRGIFRREADPTDGRRVFIALSDDAAAAVERWLAARRRILGEGPGRAGELGA